MSREEQPQQSAYRYRSGRYGSNRYSSPLSPAKNEEENKEYTGSNVDPDPDVSSGIHTQTKMTNDPFLGTVAGRLAQEIHDEFLVCKICLDSYTNPKCLSCLHTFCAKCIEKHISSEVTYNRFTDYRDFTCPICRKRTQLPPAGVRKLPDNFLIAGLTDLVLRQRASTHYSSSTTITGGCVNSNNNDHGFGGTQNSIVMSNESLDSLHQLPNKSRRNLKREECEICSQVNLQNRGHSSEPSTDKSSMDLSQRASSANLCSTPQATHMCLDCNKLLCTECVERHRLVRVTKEHAVFQLHSHCDIECKEHPGESVRFFCEVCSNAICVLCTFNTHREHEVTSFGEAVNKLRYDLAKHVELEFENVNCIQMQCQHVNEAANLVHSLERQIHATTEHFVDLIHRQEQEMINDLHQYIGQHNMELINNSAIQANQVELAELILRDVSNHLEGQDIDLLLAKKDLYQKLAEITEISTMELNFEQFSPDIYFRPGSTHLGYLTHEPESENLNEQFRTLFTPLSCPSDSNRSSTSSSVELAKRPCINSTACQTDLTSSDIPDNVAFLAKRQYRTRACNTDIIPKIDKETNTRPRGIHNNLIYSGISSNAASEEYLSKLDSEQLNLDEMDNLTRARIRRKLHERHSTFDQAPTIGNNLTNLTNGSTEQYNTRRYSNYDRRY